MLKIYKVKTSTYTPRSNGKVERSNKVIGERLRACVMDNPKSWDKCLSSVVASINNTMHSLDNVTPANIVFGRDIINPLTTNIPDPTPVRQLGDILADTLQYQQYALQVSRDLHFKQGLALQAKHNSKLKPDPFHMGDIVYYFRDTPSGTGDPLQSSKFKVKYSGPYIITRLHSNNTCSLKNLTTGMFIPHRVNRDKLKRPSFFRLIKGTPQYDNASAVLTSPHYSPKANVSPLDNLPQETLELFNPRFGKHPPNPYEKVE